VREPLPRSPEERAEDERWVDLYGPWQALDLAGAVELFEGFDRPWWLVGGWAIEAFTGIAREHEDIDVSMLACDVPAFREFVGDSWHLWSIVNGRLGPMSDDHPDLPARDAQVWVRRNASSPWVMDVPVTPDVDGLWQNKRLPDHIAALDDVTWVTDGGVRVLAPEIVLLFKARPTAPRTGVTSPVHCLCSATTSAPGCGPVSVGCGPSTRGSPTSPTPANADAAQRGARLPFWHG
jgi:hypothetical protein